MKYTSDLNELLKDDEIKLIVVCTRQDSHFEYAKLALEYNKNCLIEKPFMETSKQARKIFALAREKGLLVQAYQNRRFDSDLLTVQKVIEEGTLGDLMEIEMHYDYYCPEVPESTHLFEPKCSYSYGRGCHTGMEILEAGVKNLQ